MTNTNRDVFAKSFRVEGLKLKNVSKTLWQSPWYSNTAYTKKIAAPPHVLLEFVHNPRGSQRREVENCLAPILIFDFL